MISKLKLLLALVVVFLFLNRAPIPCRASTRMLHPLDIVSPAYGRVIAIEHVNETQTINIKIRLNLLSVHVQYAPINGTLLHQTHTSGKHHALIGSLPPTTINSNENIIYIFRPTVRESETVAVRQIAGEIARRCSSFLRTGDVVRRQQLIGRIWFGSQVELEVSDLCAIKCKVGDEVQGGVTAIASFTDA